MDNNIKPLNRSEFYELEFQLELRGEPKMNRFSYREKATILAALQLFRGQVMNHFQEPFFGEVEPLTGQQIDDLGSKIQLDMAENHMELKPCPCGQVPDMLGEFPTGNGTFTATCDKCGAWQVEFQADWSQEDGATKRANAAWNAAPRVNRSSPRKDGQNS